MKLFSIFMLVFTLGGFASGYSQKQVVTLKDVYKRQLQYGI